MTPAAIAKSLNTKRMTALAGARMPLPGHNQHREAELRAQIAADFEPRDFAEAMWVGDIAYCMATIEVIKAQIAGIRRRSVTAAYEHYWENECRRLEASTPWEADFTESEWQELHYLAHNGFEADWKVSWLDHPAFSVLMTWFSDFTLQRLQALQTLLQDKTKERDRVINQVIRGRRQALHDALARAEGQRREEAFRVAMVKQTTSAPLALPSADDAQVDAEVADGLADEAEQSLPAGHDDRHEEPEETSGGEH